MAGWLRLDDLPVAAAGHSLGELAALAAAGAVAPEDALELVVLRGRLMGEAREGTMLALLGATDTRAAELAEANRCHVANFNAPGQVVLSGTAEALAGVVAQARGEGLKAMELGVAGAFHSPAMEPAVAPFAAALDSVAWRAPAFPVVSCASAEPFTDPASELAAALVAPVRWTATMRALAALGAETFVDVGPGRVLAKLVRRTLPEAAHA
jgi:malonyl CoA-acyl carrier protein transacylase